WEVSSQNARASSRFGALDSSHPVQSVPAVQPPVLPGGSRPCPDGVSDVVGNLLARSEATHGSAQRQQRRRRGEMERAGGVARLRQPSALGFYGSRLRRGRRGGDPQNVGRGSGT